MIPYLIPATKTWVTFLISSIITFIMLVGFGWYLGYYVFENQTSRKDRALKETGQVVGIGATAVALSFGIVYGMSKK